jgi:hypothetical protein
MCDSAGLVQCHNGSCVAKADGSECPVPAFARKIKTRSPSLTVLELALIPLISVDQDLEGMLTVPPASLRPPAHSSSAGHAVQVSVSSLPDSALRALLSAQAPQNWLDHTSGLATGAFSIGSDAQGGGNFTTSLELAFMHVARPYNESGDLCLAFIRIGDGQWVCEPVAIVNSTSTLLAPMSLAALSWAGQSSATASIPHSGVWAIVLRPAYGEESPLAWSVWLWLFLTCLCSVCLYLCCRALQRRKEGLENAGAAASSEMVLNGVDGIELTATTAVPVLPKRTFSGGFSALTDDDNADGDDADHDSGRFDTI